MPSFFITLAKKYLNEQLIKYRTDAAKAWGQDKRKQKIKADHVTTLVTTISSLQDDTTNQAIFELLLASRRTVLVDIINYEYKKSPKNIQELLAKLEPFNETTKVKEINEGKLGICFSTMFHTLRNITHILESLGLTDQEYNQQDALQILQYHAAEYLLEKEIASPGWLSSLVHSSSLEVTKAVQLKEQLNTLKQELLSLDEDDQHYAQDYIDKVKAKIDVIRAFNVSACNDHSASSYMPLFISSINVGGLNVATHHGKGDLDEKLKKVEAEINLIPIPQLIKDI